MVYGSHNFYLKFWLGKGVNVMAWNYRGYGKSSGTPTPKNLVSDAEKVYEYLVNDLKITGKIGVYGRSLGGIPSAHLQSKVHIAIVDRTFSNFDSMARSRFDSYFASLLFKIGSCGWQIQSDENLLRKASNNKPTTYKVVMVDKNDTVVPLQSSIMVGIA